MFIPNNNFSKNQTVNISPCSFSKDQVPKEIGKLGNIGYVLQSSKLHQSRPNSKPIYVTRIKFSNNKYETFLTKDLQPMGKRA